MTIARVLLLLLLLLPALSSSSVLAQKSGQTVTLPAVRWVFDIKMDKHENPHGDVYLRVGKKRFHVLATSSGFQTLARADYKDHKVPADALTACSGWWAGQGDDLYVVRRGRRLDVYQRGLDEQTDIPPYKRIKSIPLPP